MSTDRDLLLFAAKAAGIDLSGKGMSQLFNVDGYLNHTWNPLNDNNCAFLLMTFLCIELEFDSVRVYAFIPGSNRTQRSSEFYDSHDNDKAAATRRAITRAAAYVGEIL